MRIPVYLASNRLHDRLGAAVAFPERRLIPRSRDDRVIAMIEAPAGTRVRRRRDEHGTEQLLVPLGTSPWARFFGERAVIPAKYVIGCAREGAYGLSLVAVSQPELQI